MNSQEAKCLQSGTPDLSDFHINPFFQKFQGNLKIPPASKFRGTDF